MMDRPLEAEILNQEFAEAEAVLGALASVFGPGGEVRSFFSQGNAPAGGSELDVETTYRTLVEQLPAVVFLAFLDEGVGKAYVSPHIEATLGFKQEEWLSDPVRWYRQIHPEDRSRWSVEAAQLLLTGEPLHSTYRVIARDGRVVWFDCQAKMVRRADGRPWFIHGLGFDVTELKETEAALKRAHDELETRVRERTAELAKVNADLEAGIAERLQAEAELARRAQELTRSNSDLEQFAYSASHDLQEPIRNIAVYSELLRRRYGGMLDAEAGEYIGYLVEGAHRMEFMVRDLLSYARIASAAHETEELLDANAIVSACLETLQIRVKETGATITADPLPRVRMARVHLEQLLQNLISNAIKYRSEAPPRIYLSARREAGEWIFSVKDNGIGILPEYHEKIFGIFKRLHGRHTYPGTGIGLAICKRIVERYGGRIWVESGQYRGSTFFFTLPVDNK